MSLLREIKDAVRQLRRTPGFALLVVVTLGLPMGVSTAFFSIANRSMFEPWPVKDPDRVVVSRNWVSLEQARFWKEHAKLFDGIAMQRPGFGASISGRSVNADFVSANYFDVLGIPLIAGRRFSTRDDTPDADRTEEIEAIISHRTWTLFFDGDPAVLGRSFLCLKKSVRVVGITAPGFDGVERVRLPRKHFWLSLADLPRINPGKGDGKEDWDSIVVGRRAEGVTKEQAENELKTLSARFPWDPKDPIEPFRLSGTTAYEQRPPGDRDRAMAYTALLANVFLTLIACANVSNFFLARGHTRRGDIAVRLSLGAARGSLVRQLLVEALLLALVAGAVGMAVASVLPQHLFNTLPQFGEWMQLEFGPDRHVFVWTFCLSSLVCIVFGLNPALRSTRIDVNHVLKETDCSSAPALKTSFTAAQALVSVAALGIATLTLRSGQHVQALRFARAVESTMVVPLEFPETFDASRRPLARREILQSFTSSFDAANVAAASGNLRLAGFGDRVNIGVTPAYFDLTGLRLIAGRTFASTDAADRVVVVNESLARSLWPGENALGKLLKDANKGAPQREVVGIVGAGYADQVSFTPLAPEKAALVFARVSEPTVKTVAARAAAAVDPGLKLDVVRGRDWAAQSQPRAAFLIRLFSEFGALALLLAATGLYSLSDYAVRQRTREIGIRRALGARSREVLEAVFRPAGRSLMRGMVAGLFVTLCGGLMMRHYTMIEGVDPFDPWVYGLVAGAALLASLIATWRPSRHALKVEPAVALRYE